MPSLLQKLQAQGKPRFQSVCPGFRMSSLYQQPELCPPDHPLHSGHGIQMEQVCL